MDKKITGREIKAINKVFSTYCEDLKCDDNNKDFYIFEIKQNNELYEIKIKDSRIDLGGDAFYIINSNTLKIIKKTYGE